jgi:hypothetical protein
MNKRFADTVIFACEGLVSASTPGLPYVTGYGTGLFQLIVLGAWSIIARLSSGKFADQHHGVLWAVAFLLNIICFNVVAVPLWLLTRERMPKLSAISIVCFTVLYVAALFVLFPATDGP